jgi:uncharacterized membrane protein HdeD (DUF308 family)
MWDMVTKNPAGRRIASRIMGIAMCLLGFFVFDLSLFDPSRLSRLIEFLAALCFCASGLIRIWLARRSRRLLDSPY